MEAKGNPYMEVALDEMDKISQSEKERYLYLREAMALSDEASRMATARKEGIREGISRGISRGISQGISQGILEGISQGVQVVIRIYHELGISREETQTKLEKDFSISAEAAQEYMEKFW